MKSNAEKCNLLVSTNDRVRMNVDVFKIDKNDTEKLLGVKFESAVVQRIMKKNSSGKSVHTNCCGHNLALVIYTACKLVMIRNALDTVKDTCMMFVRGSKKESLLCDVIKENLHFSENQKPIFDICVTRWAENLLHG